MIAISTWIGSADEPVLVKSVGTQLPVQDLRAMELDEARGRLYIAQGAGSNLPLVVTDLDGVLQTKLTAVTPDLSENWYPEATVTTTLTR